MIRAILKTSICAALVITAWAVKVEATEPVLSINLRLQPYLTCGLGDLDLIAFDIGGEKNSLLLEVEEIGGASPTQVLRFQATPLQLKTGIGETLELPFANRNRLLVFNICSDSQKTGRCTGKPVANILEIQHQLVGARKTSTTAHALHSVDKKYFLRFNRTHAEWNTGARERRGRTFSSKRAWDYKAAA